MSCIIRSLNKRNGIVYVYESESYWDKDTKMPRCHRRLIGKVDPQTGEVVPTGKRGRPRKDKGGAPPNPESAGTDMDSSSESREETRLRAALQSSEEHLAKQDARIKSLEDEVRRLSYNLKRLGPAVDSLEKSLKNLREISNSVGEISNPVE